MQILRANRRRIRFDKPGITFCSRITIGTRETAAATPIGADA